MTIDSAVILAVAKNAPRINFKDKELSAIMTDKEVGSAGLVYAICVC